MVLIRPGVSAGEELVEIVVISVKFDAFRGNQLTMRDHMTGRLTCFIEDTIHILNASYRDPENVWFLRVLITSTLRPPVCT